LKDMPMELIADGLLIATAMTAGLYCLVLSRRLRRLTESGEGIGPQIEALDQALNETRAALAETREGVSELRASSKAAVVQLTRETARGEEMAERIEHGLKEANATMQRLYQAHDRIEANEDRQEKAVPGGSDNREGNADEGAGEALHMIEAQAVSGADPGIDWPDESGGEDNEPGRGDSESRRQVALPGGEIVESDAPPAAASGDTRPQSGSVLKAERVML
jgi:hypothetical protein